VSLLLAAPVLLFAALSDDEEALPAWAVKHGLKRYNKADKAFLRMLGEIVQRPSEGKTTGAEQVTKFMKRDFQAVQGKLVPVTILIGRRQGAGPDAGPIEFFYNPPVLVRVTDYDPTASNEWYDSYWDIKVDEYRDGVEYPDLDRMVWTDGPAYEVKS